MSLPWCLVHGPTLRKCKCPKSGTDQPTGRPSAETPELQRKNHAGEAGEGDEQVQVAGGEPNGVGESVEGMFPLGDEAQQGREEHQGTWGRGKITEIENIDKGES